MKRNAGMGTAKPGEARMLGRGRAHGPRRLSWHSSEDLFIQKAAEGGGTQHHSVTAVESGRFDGHLGALILKVPLSLESLL